MIELQYGEYYTAPTGDDVDFLFDIVDAESGSNFMDLPQIQITGYGTVPDWSMGNVVLKMPYITGGLDGTREANGIISLPALTLGVLAAINNPIQMPMLVVSGLTGIGGGMTFPALSIAAMATQAYEVGNVLFPDFVIDATADNPWMARGGMTLPWVRYEGRTGVSAVLVMPKISVSSTAISLAPATGRIILPSMVLDGSADTEHVGIGGYLIPRCSIAATAVMGIVGSGQFVLPSVSLNASGHISLEDDMTATYLLTSLTITGTITNSKAPYIIRHVRYKCYPPVGEFSIPMLGIIGTTQ